MTSGEDGNGQEEAYDGENEGACQCNGAESAEGRVRVSSSSWGDVDYLDQGCCLRSGHDGGGISGARIIQRRPASKDLPKSIMMSSEVPDLKRDQMVPAISVCILLFSRDTMTNEMHSSLSTRYSFLLIFALFFRVPRDYEQL
jgi:hypothetical protein